jgi:anti-sigma factor RsiW
MADETIHELTAAYALDALDDGERDAYEEHLAMCARCRDELGTLSEAAGSLAYGVHAPSPPPSLRGRILEAASAERSNVVPLRRRRAFQAVAAIAAVAAGLAIGFGVWAASLHNRLGDQQSASAQLRAALAVLGDKRAQRIALGANGSLVVTPSGEAALVTNGLPAAPPGKAYEAWVIRGGKPLPAGLMRGGHAIDVLRLERPVPPRSSVALTLEPQHGSKTPTGAPILRGQA